ncbi:RNA-directed DNA polymerase, eukaryota, reverse transcriptase zinc-binding domain protein [Tanacetum coccineum]|uniref:RNA-directed DNA polymerase, eukaryota, reverse transcriptase zinc-binding domain protein n=1 Tax=Tanacetum coccineum TaxID=301880 RepID=A0ABQ5G7W5_9ASTR
MQEFRNCINNTEAEDIGSTGFFYTWTKSLRNADNSVLKKLDRIMVNERFIEEFTGSHGIFQPFLISDHSPAILIIPTVWQKKTKSFRFANYTADKPEFIAEVERGWKIQVQGYKMYCLVKRLKSLKPVLNKLNWKNGDLTARVESLRVQLQEAQTLVERDPHNSIIKSKAIEALNNYNEAVNDEEKLLAQKTRIDWLNEGDKNSAFFHKMIKGRRSRNRVDSICDENRVRYVNEEVPMQFVKHFQQFLGKSYEASELSTGGELFCNILTQEEAEFMVREISDKEVKDAMFDIGDNRAPGPDGFSSLFFKRAWNVVGKDVCEGVKEFFSSGQMLGELNATLITLVPKLQTPNKVSDFRPIACCNVLYKCISKIITNRIKSALKNLVQINQSAFIPGRVIQDNIMLSQEILRGYGRKTRPKRCAMKIDLQKAYDTISWNFLEAILKNFSFHHIMVRWIMKCVQTAGFSICINGERHGYFKGGRGIRQGDPMSPYLFTLVMEVLTLLLQRKIRENHGFKYHYGCKELKMVNLCFADDLMIFCHGDPLSAGVIKDAIQEFSDVSGLFPNLNKSTLYFGCMVEAEKEQIRRIMQINEGSLPTKYLGVPLITKCLGVKDCQNLVDKIKGRTEDWKCKYLSYAGRLMLIATVLESMSMYWASVFKLPKTVIKEINGILKRFLWSNGDTAKGRAKLSWKQVCKPKEFGGLGIKNLETWNEALLAKNLWNLASKKTLYGDKIASRLQYEVGNGSQIHMRFDRWHSSGLLIEQITYRDLYDARMPKMISIADMIDKGNWKWPSAWRNEGLEIMNINVPRLKTDKKDVVKWKGDNDNLVPFHVKWVMKALTTNEDKVKWYDLVWFKWCIPKHSFCLWIAMIGRLLTQDKIMAWGVQTGLLCSLCKKVNDSHDHLFFQCDYSKEVWNRMATMMNMDKIDYQWNEVVSDLLKYKHGKNIWSAVRRISFAAMIYYIWQERNQRIFRGENRDTNDLFKAISEVIKLKQMNIKVRNTADVRKVAELWEIQFASAMEISNTLEFFWVLVGYSPSADVNGAIPFMMMPVAWLYLIPGVWDNSSGSFTALFEINADI